MTQTTEDELVEGLPTLITIEAAAKHVGQSTRTIRNWIAQKRFAVVKTSESGSGRVLIPRAEFARYLAAKLRRA